ncbi:MAG: hypothetical protein AVDCRST_MAG72-1049 [uncultured Nocardioidaceae bacterium]|uniref:Uncharacterized protein n=1 Tax=uncultured Nocardioidaceae bacterium TaxID=253824 RepID=A0A6J4LYD8_9ACTN|nr:MAG: hypothetical protein AVDCRST_MAG72-1049 [uncultured Nocardioidaceae bacterium]
MVPAMPDQRRRLSRASALLVVASASVAGGLAAADPSLRAALLPDRGTAGLVGTVGAFGLALALGEVLHGRSRRPRYEKG